MIVFALCVTLIKKKSWAKEVYQYFPPLVAVMLNPIFFNVLFSIQHEREQFATLARFKLQKCGNAISNLEQAEKCNLSVNIWGSHVYYSSDNSSSKWYGFLPLKTALPAL